MALAAQALALTWERPKLTFLALALLNAELLPTASAAMDARTLSTAEAFVSLAAKAHTDFPGPLIQQQPSWPQQRRPARPLHAACGHRGPPVLRPLLHGR